MGRIDILTGTLGKALGGGSGGYTSGRKEIVEMLRQRSRPYLFSNTLPPPIVAASLKALELLSQSTAAARPLGGQHPLLPRADEPGSASRSCPASIPSCPSCWATPRWPRGWPSGCWSRAST